MNDIDKFSKQFNKYVWKKLKMYFKNKSNSDENITNSMIFKIETLFLNYVPIGILIMLKEEQQIGWIQTEAYEYCMKKSKRQENKNE